MKILFIYCTILLCACSEGKKDDSEQRTGKTDKPKQKEVHKEANHSIEKLNFTSYQNQDFNFQLQFPENWRKHEQKKASKPIINLYSQKVKAPDLPVTVHAPANFSFIAIVPKGYGTELPSGRSKTAQNYNGNIPVSISIDKKESMVFLLENGNAWAYFLIPENPPQNWNQYGFIFAQLAVDNLQMVCLDKASGEEISMQDCNPLSGDSIKRYGNVASESKKEIRKALNSFSFARSEGNQESEKLIRVHNPEPNSLITSPLHISGEAKGYWFFEANFPVELVDENNNILATGIAEAEGDWMTKNFVPFKVILQFETPDTPGGFLIFKKQNASGKPKHRQTYKIPVRF